MSDTLGPQQLGKVKGEVFLGYDKGHEADYSDEVAGDVDAEVRTLIDDGPRPRRATILSAHRATLDVLADALVEKETLEDSELAEIFGPLDKGTGIEARSRSPPRSRAIVESTEPVGAAVAEAQPVAPAGQPSRSAPPPSVGGGSAAACGPRGPRHLIHVTRERPAIDTPMDLPRIEKAVREILVAIGEDPDRDGLLDTPARVARMYAEIFAGLHEDPAEHLTVTFEVEPRRDGHGAGHPAAISCASTTSIPFIGKAHVAYIPSDDGRITGLSKLARLVDGYARRPQVQERLTVQIADAIERTLEPRGVHGGHRGRAPLHVDARRPQARLDHGHLGRARACSARNVATRQEAMRFVTGRG